MPHFNEDVVEQAALDWLHNLGYTIRHGETIAPGEPAAERTDYGEVLLIGRLRAALARINVHIPRSARPEVIDEVIRKITRTQSQNPLVNNHAFHRLLTDGVDVSYRAGGQVRYDKVWLVDFTNPGANDWLAVNQFTITDVNLQSHARTNRRPDVMLFINGLPLVLIELKNPADESATVRKAFNQLQTYQEDIPSVFTYNALLAISDGVDARLGVLGAGWEWFKPWRTVDGDVLAPSDLETLIKGVFARERLLDLMRYFIVFEQGDSKLIKKVAGYHQYHAVNKAVQKTIDATPRQRRQKGRRGLAHAGIGQEPDDAVLCGQSHPASGNGKPDAGDADRPQRPGRSAVRHVCPVRRYCGRSRCRAESRAHLRELLQVASGGVVFTTIQKFMPEEKGGRIRCFRSGTTSC